MKFNSLSKTKDLITNNEGAQAFKLNAEMELYTAVVTWSLSDSFYEKDDVCLDRLQSLISRCNPNFVGKLAVYTRTQMHILIRLCG